VKIKPYDWIKHKKSKNWCLAVRIYDGFLETDEEDQVEKEDILELLPVGELVLVSHDGKKWEQCYFAEYMPNKEKGDFKCLDSRHSNMAWNEIFEHDREDDNNIYTRSFKYIKSIIVDTSKLILEDQWKKEGEKS
jgi:hypothetical protein